MLCVCVSVFKKKKTKDFDLYWFQSEIVGQNYIPISSIHQQGSPGSLPSLHECMSTFSRGQSFWELSSSKALEVTSCDTGSDIPCMCSFMSTSQPWYTVAALQDWVDLFFSLHFLHFFLNSQVHLTVMRPFPSKEDWLWGPGLYDRSTLISFWGK